MQRTYRFPFVRIRETAEYRPLLPITIINPENNLDDFGWAIIDTGADRSAFPEHVAKKIYHDIKNKKTKIDYIETAGGFVKVYKHTFEIKIHAMKMVGPNIKIGKTVIRIPNMLVDVIPLITENNEGKPVHTSFRQIVLGVEDFIKNYVVTFDYPNRTFSLSK